MKKPELLLFVAASICFFTTEVLAQRAGNLARNIEDVLASAQIDFREYRKNPAAVPSLSSNLTAFYKSATEKTDVSFGI